MLHVLLLLLKILGILLLLIIGLFLLVLLTPIRYSFELEKEEQVEPKFVVRVTWLFWLFYFKTSYIEKAFDYRVRILGHQIAGNQPQFLERQKERQKRKAEKEKAREERERNKKDRKSRKKSVEEKSGKSKKTRKPEETEGNLPITVTEKKAFIQKKVPEEDILQSDLSADAVADIPENISVDTSAESKNQSRNSVSEQKAEEAVSKEGASDALKGKEKANSETKVKKKNVESKKPKRDNKETKEDNEKKDKKAKKESPFKKIKGKIKSLKETKANLDKLPWREWLELGKDIFIRFLKHVLPGKLEGSITFGLGDPEYTGYITGIAAIFYPKYGEHFSLYPDFEKKMFEAKCKGRGRIRPGYMLVLVVSILKEKSIRTMIKNIILG